VTYSSECNDELNGNSIYAPSYCIGYYRERTSSQCNGKEICVIDNSLEQRPSFLIGKQANCAFKGQSINIEYSCIPDFYSNELPSIDICSLETLDNIKEGFIHSPNYPNNYPNSLTCSKTIPAPATRNRLKIYVLDFDIESIRVTRLTSVTQINDWLEINNNGEKLYGIRSPFTLLFDDVIEASLTFKSDLTNTKRPYHGFLLYFIVTPIRRSRPSVTTTNSAIFSDEDSTSIIQQKVAALFTNKPRENKSNVTSILLVVLLSGILFIMICAFLLYKRRNDRRIRYLTETFNSFIPKRSKSMTTDSSDNSYETKLNSKIDSSSISNEDHIYSQDPLDKKNDENTLLYDCIDYETINQPLKPNENIV